MRFAVFFLERLKELAIEKETWSWHVRVSEKEKKGHRPVTPCYLSPHFSLLPLSLDIFFFAPFWSFCGRAEEMTHVHVPLHTILQLALTPHGCQITELKTNVDAVDDHELL